MLAVSARIKETLSARQARDRVLRRLGAELEGVLRDPSHFVIRPCPACETSDLEPTPCLRAPVYDFFRCRRCTLVYAPRVLGREVTQEIAESLPAYRAYWQLLRADALRPDNGNAYASLCGRLLRLSPGRDVVLDVGCRFGALLKELAPHFRTAIGLERNRRTASAGRELLGVTIRSERLEELGRAPGSVDLIVMNQVLEHLHEVRPVLTAAFRLLKPRGVLYVGIPNGASLGLRVKGGSHLAVSTHVHVNLFNPRALAVVAHDTGFTVLKNGTDDVLDLPLADWLLERGSTRLRFATLPLLAMEQVLRRAMLVTRLPSRLGVGAHVEAALVKPPEKWSARTLQKGTANGRVVF